MYVYMNTKRSTGPMIAKMLAKMSPEERREALSEIAKALTEEEAAEFHEDLSTIHKWTGAILTKEDILAYIGDDEDITDNIRHDVVNAVIGSTAWLEDIYAETYSTGFDMIEGIIAEVTDRI